jgi:hypothetical protein
MSGEHASAFLEATIGDTLDPSEAGIADAAASRAHVDACAGCTRLRDEIRAAAAFASRAYATDPEGDAALAAAVTARLAAGERAPRGRVFTIRRAAAAAAAMLAVAAGVAAWRLASSPQAATTPGGTEVAAAPAAAGMVPGYAGPHFVDVTAGSGIDGVDHTGSADSKDWMIETVGHGAAAFDMDGDGDLDLFVPDGNRLDPAERVRDGWRLYRNDGAMRFTDVTKGSGLECDSWAGGAVAGDVTGDGLPDLYVACFGKNHLFVNRGGGKFDDATDAAGVAGLESEWSTAAAMGDFDGNGALDIFVSNYADMRRFISQASGPRGCKWRGMAVACGPQPLDPQQDRLYLNRGDGTFDDVTATNLPRVRRYSFQCVALDLNADGATDVFVAADGQPNLLFLNDGHGVFTEQARAAGVSSDASGRDQACMGVAAGDADGDGMTDLFVTNFSHEPNTLYRAQSARGVPSFADLTAATGLVERDALLGWGAAFIDFDCDGAPDVMFANGHLYPGVEANVPTTAYAQPLSLYRNAGGARFSEITASASTGIALTAPRVHRGLVVADFDDDGLPDAFVTVLNGRALMLRNDGHGAGHTIRFAVRRKGGLVDAAGARVVVTLRGPDGAERRLVRDLLLGSSFGSSEDPRPIFGLGAASRVETVEVTWPGGGTQKFPAMDAGHLYEIVEGRAEAARLR